MHPHRPNQQGSDYGSGQGQNRNQNFGPSNTFGSNNSNPRYNRGGGRGGRHPSYQQNNPPNSSFYQDQYSSYGGGTYDGFNNFNMMQQQQPSMLADPTTQMTMQMQQQQHQQRSQQNIPPMMSSMHMGMDTSSQSSYYRGLDQPIPPQPVLPQPIPPQPVLLQPPPPPPMPPMTPMPPQPFLPQPVGLSFYPQSSRSTSSSSFPLQQPVSQTLSQPPYASTSPVFSSLSSTTTVNTTNPATVGTMSSSTTSSTATRGSIPVINLVLKASNRGPTKAPPGVTRRDVTNLQSTTQPIQSIESTPSIQPIQSVELVQNINQKMEDGTTKTTATANASSSLGFTPTIPTLVSRVEVPRSLPVSTTSDGADSTTTVSVLDLITQKSRAIAERRDREKKEKEIEEERRLGRRRRREAVALLASRQNITSSVLSRLDQVSYLSTPVDNDYDKDYNVTHQNFSQNSSIVEKENKEDTRSDISLPKSIHTTLPITTSVATTEFYRTHSPSIETKATPKSTVGGITTSTTPLSIVPPVSVVPSTSTAPAGLTSMLQRIKATMQKVKNESNKSLKPVGTSTITATMSPPPSSPFVPAPSSTLSADIGMSDEQSSKPVIAVETIIKNSKHVKPMHRKKTMLNLNPRHQPLLDECIMGTNRANGTNGTMSRKLAPARIGVYGTTLNSTHSHFAPFKLRKSHYPSYTSYLRYSPGISDGFTPQELRWLTAFASRVCIAIIRYARMPHLVSIFAMSFIHAVWTKHSPRELPFLELIITAVTMGAKLAELPTKFVDVTSALLNLIEFAPGPIDMKTYKQTLWKTEGNEISPNTTSNPRMNEFSIPSTVIPSANSNPSTYSSFPLSGNGSGGRREVLPTPTFTPSAIPTATTFTSPGYSGCPSILSHPYLSSTSLFDMMVSSRATEAYEFWRVQHSALAIRDLIWLGMTSPPTSQIASEEEDKEKEKEKEKEEEEEKGIIKLIHKTVDFMYRTTPMSPIERLDIALQSLSISSIQSLESAITDSYKKRASGLEKQPQELKQRGQGQGQESKQNQSITSQSSSSYPTISFPMYCILRSIATFNEHVAPSFSSINPQRSNDKPDKGDKTSNTAATKEGRFTLLPLLSTLEILIFDSVRGSVSVEAKNPHSYAQAILERMLPTTSSAELRALKAATAGIITNTNQNRNYAESLFQRETARLLWQQQVRALVPLVWQLCDIATSSLVFPCYPPQILAVACVDIALTLTKTQLGRVPLPTSHIHAITFQSEEEKENRSRKENESSQFEDIESYNPFPFHSYVPIQSSPLFETLNSLARSHQHLFCNALQQRIITHGKPVENAENMESDNEGKLEKLNQAIERAYEAQSFYEEFPDLPSTTSTAKLGSAALRAVSDTVTPSIYDSVYEHQKNKKQSTSSSSLHGLFLRSKFTSPHALGNFTYAEALESEGVRSRKKTRNSSLRQKQKQNHPVLPILPIYGAWFHGILPGLAPSVVDEACAGIMDHLRIYCAVSLPTDNDDETIPSFSADGEEKSREMDRGMYTRTFGDVMWKQWVSSHPVNGRQLSYATSNSDKLYDDTPWGTPRSLPSYASLSTLKSKFNNRGNHGNHGNHGNNDNDSEDVAVYDAVIRSIRGHTVSGMPQASESTVVGPQWVPCSTNEEGNNSVKDYRAVLLQAIVELLPQKHRVQLSEGTTPDVLTFPVNSQRTTDDTPLRLLRIADASLFPTRFPVSAFVEKKESGKKVKNEQLSSQVDPRNHSSITTLPIYYKTKANIKDGDALEDIALVEHDKKMYIQNKDTLYHIADFVHRQSSRAETIFASHMRKSLETTVSMLPSNDLDPVSKKRREHRSRSRSPMYRRSMRMQSHSRSRSRSPTRSPSPLPSRRFRSRSRSLSTRRLKRSSRSPSRSRSPSIRRVRHSSRSPRSPGSPRSSRSPRSPRSSRSPRIRSPLDREHDGYDGYVRYQGTGTGTSNTTQRYPPRYRDRVHPRSHSRSRSRSRSPPSRGGYRREPVLPRRESPLSVSSMKSFDLLGDPDIVRSSK